MSLLMHSGLASTTSCYPIAAHPKHPMPRKLYRYSSLRHCESMGLMTTRFWRSTPQGQQRSWHRNTSENSRRALATHRTVSEPAGALIVPMWHKIDAIDSGVVGHQICRGGRQDGGRPASVGPMRGGVNARDRIPACGVSGEE